MIVDEVDRRLVCGDSQMLYLVFVCQVYTMKQEKRGLCPYDDKRYLLADLPDGRPKPNTHAYGHSNLAAEEHLVADQPEPGAELIIRQREERFAHRRARVTRRLKLAGAMDMEEEELPDGNSDGELHGDQLLVGERMAAARPGGAIRMGDVIERIIARDNRTRPVSPPVRMPAPPTPQRAGPSGLNAYLPPFRCRVDFSDEEEPEPPVWPPRRPRLEFDVGDYEQEDIELEPPRRRKRARRRANPFIDSEAGVDGKASGDEGSEDENYDLDGIIVVDDVEC